MNADKGVCAQFNVYHHCNGSIHTRIFKAIFANESWRSRVSRDFLFNLHLKSGTKSNCHSWNTNPYHTKLQSPRIFFLFLAPVSSVKICIFYLRILNVCVMKNKFKNKPNSLTQTKHKPKHGVILFENVLHPTNWWLKNKFSLRKKKNNNLRK